MGARLNWSHKSQAVEETTSETRRKAGLMLRAGAATILMTYETSSSDSVVHQPPYYQIYRRENGLNIVTEKETVTVSYSGAIFTQ